MASTNVSQPVVAAVTGEGLKQKTAVVIAALIAMSTNWDQAEVRTGRRGQYRTTGASMIRLREVKPEIGEQVAHIAGMLGLELDDEDIEEMFNGDFEFQISYACNRFATKTGTIGSTRITQNEMRTLERAAEILKRKDSAEQVLRERTQRRVA